jgi:sugar/nucleoside kinase (ribokinase family)
MLALRPDPVSGFRQVVGVGGIGSGIVFALEGEQTLGRNESRLGKLLDARDYCKLHIVVHYIARLMGAGKVPNAFDVVPIGVIGQDSIGRRLREEMEEAGLDTQFVRSDPGAKTLFSVCFVYQDGSGGNITTNNSAASEIGTADLQAAQNRMKKAGPRGIALCLPEVPLEVRQEFLRISRECGNFSAASFVSSEIAPAREMNLYASVDLLALNKEEAAAIVGYPFEASRADHFLKDCSATLLDLQPNIQIVLTAGEHGAYGFEKGAWQFCQAPRVSVVSTAGAGDALMAGILSGLSAGLPFLSSVSSNGTSTKPTLQAALDLGVLAASFSVTSPHTIHPEASLSTIISFAELHGIEIPRKIRVLCHEVRTDPVLARQELRGA